MTKAINRKFGAFKKDIRSFDGLCASYEELQNGLKEKNQILSKNSKSDVTEEIYTELSQTLNELEKKELNSELYGKLKIGLSWIVKQVWELIFISLAAYQKQYQKAPKNWSQKVLMALPG